jgi:anti-anti-sigma regulatory factor
VSHSSTFNEGQYIGVVMRNSVPFIGEEQILRAESEQASQKRQAGKLIDDVISSAEVESSWEDTVPDTWKSNRDKAIRSPAGKRSSQTKSLVQGSAQRVVNKPAAHKTDIKKDPKPASVDWVPINSGHGLLVRVVGNVDYGLRDEWRRLLEETASVNANEYEINLQAAPGLSMTGLGMLLLFKERKSREHKNASRDRIVLSHCNQDVWKLLSWTGMDKYFVIQKG